MTTDDNGMEYIYAKKTDGIQFTMDNDDPLGDNHFQLGGSVTKLVDKSGGWWGVNNPHQVRLNCKKFPEAEDSLGGCNFDFSEAVARGYGYKKDDFRDIEVKMLLDVRSLDPHVLIGGPTGHHPSNSDPCCQGFSYFIRFQNTPTLQLQFGKEMFHNTGYESLTPVQNTAIRSTGLDNGIIGIGYVRYNSTLADGRDAVTIEGYIDADGDGKDWKLWKREVDFVGRGWYKSGAEGTICNGVKDQPGFWGNLRVRIRWDDDNADVRFKSVSFQEIAPFAPVTTPGGDEGGGGTSGGGSVPETPTFGFVPITFRRHFNFVRGFTCATPPGVPSSKTFYEQLQFNGTDGTDLTHDGDAAGEVCKNTNSVMFSKIISEGTIYATKHGSGTDLKIRVRGPGVPGTIRATLATISAASIGTSQTTLPWVAAPTNTYAIAVNDRFSVEEDGSPSSSNYISVARHSSVSYDGSNSVRFTIDNGTYEEKSGDLTAIIKEY